MTRRADVGVSRSGPAVGLTNRLRELTRATLPASIGGGALVTVAGLLRGTGLRRAVTGGVAVAVAAVPEGLPLVATLAQQAAARRLTAAGVLVRAPRSIEALGRVDVVCFDKTGTSARTSYGWPRSNASTAGTKARFWKLRRAVPWEVATIACFIRRMPPSSMQPSKLWTTLRFSVTSRRTTSFRSGRGGRTRQLCSAGGSHSKVRRNS